jgi:Sulfotransferase family
VTPPLPDLAGIGDLLRSGLGLVASARAFGREVPLAGGRAPAHAVGALGAKAAAEPGGLILVLGAPRSGTTWLGKIFDSHPDVLYRHEPESPRTRCGAGGCRVAVDLPAGDLT